MSYKKEMQRIVRLFEENTGRVTYTPKEVARWAIEKGLWKPPTKLAIQKCADDISDALREEYAQDPTTGRKYRTKHCVTRVRNGELFSEWADMHRASPEHMKRAFQQRRRAIVGDCRQLKIDCDYYNDNCNIGPQIVINFNFGDDVREATQVSGRESNRLPRQFDEVLRASEASPVRSH